MIGLAPAHKYRRTIVELVPAQDRKQAKGGSVILTQYVGAIALPHDALHGDLGSGRLAVLAKIKPVLVWTRFDCECRCAVLAIWVRGLELHQRSQCLLYWCLRLSKRKNIKNDNATEHIVQVLLYSPDGGTSGPGEVIIGVTPQLFLCLVVQITLHVRVLVLAAAGEVKVTLESPSEVGLWANSYRLTL